MGKGRGAPLFAARGAQMTVNRISVKLVIALHNMGNSRQPKLARRRPAA
jgi:hypothetical protein